MRLEQRRRVHADHSGYHEDLVLICETDQEAHALDVLTGGSEADATVVHAEVRISDTFENYVLLRRSEGNA